MKNVISIPFNKSVLPPLAQFVRIGFYRAQASEPLLFVMRMMLQVPFVKSFVEFN